MAPISRIPKKIDQIMYGSSKAKPIDIPGTEIMIYNIRPLTPLDIWYLREANTIAPTTDNSWYLIPNQEKGLLTRERMELAQKHRIKSIIANVLNPTPLKRRV